MSSCFKQLSNIDDRTKHCVNGWIREAEREISVGYIPHMIRSICILYFRDDEIFAVVVNEKITTLSKNKKIATVTKRLDLVNLFGFMKIPSMKDIVCRWDIKIHNVPSADDIDCVGIGVVVHHKEDDLSDLHTASYQYDNDGSTGPGCRYGVESASINDVMSVELDLCNEQVHFFKNNSKQRTFGNVKRGKDMIYRLMVEIYDKTCIEILNFCYKN